MPVTRSIPALRHQPRHVASCGLRCGARRLPGTARLPQRDPRRRTAPRSLLGRPPRAVTGRSSAPRAASGAPPPGSPTPPRAARPRSLTVNGRPPPVNGRSPSLPHSSSAPRPRRHHGLVPPGSVSPPGPKHRAPGRFRAGIEGLGGARPVPAAPAAAAAQPRRAPAAPRARRAPTATLPPRRLRRRHLG